MFTQAANPQSFNAVKMLVTFTTRRLCTSRPKHKDTLNEIRLIGGVGQPPKELFHANSEHSSVTFPLATNNSWKNKDGEIATRTDWHRIMLFQQNQKDFVLKNVEKGDFVMVAGRAQNNLVYDEDGKVKGSNHYVRAERIMLLSKKYNAPEPEYASSPSSAEDGFPEEDSLLEQDSSSSGDSSPKTY